MPSAFRNTGEENLAREYFEHAHNPNSTSFPSNLSTGATNEMIWKCPTSWAGFSLVRLWFLGEYNDVDVPLTVVIHAGTCTEVYNIHTQTDNTLTIATTAGVYTCLNITTDFATVLGLISPCDLVRIQVTNNDGETDCILMGVEIVET